MTTMTTEPTVIRRGRRKENGRAGARNNAVKHGLWARDVVLAHEDRDAFDAYLAAFREHLAPQGPLEEALVQVIVVSLWRFWRTLRIEAAAMDKTYQDSLSARTDFTPSQREQRALIASVNNQWLENIHRCQTTIDRQFHRALRKLESLQSARGAAGFSLPPSALAGVALMPPAPQPEPR